jgi:hypothetical protein
MLLDEFPELLQFVDSPHISRPWGHPIDIIGPMRRQRLNRLSSAKREELNRWRKDVVDSGLVRPSRSEFGSPTRFVRKGDGSPHVHRRPRSE